MFFKGNLYITDPCYITRDEDWMSPEGFDIDNYTINAAEFSDYLIEDTGIGDGSWSIYEMKIDPTISLEDIRQIIEGGNFEDYEVIGTFAADAGMSCVVYKNEADVYNPDWKKEILNPNVYATLKGFEGEIVSFFDSNDELHFIGSGNKIFFTA